jgi:hypothetical protein
MGLRAGKEEVRDFFRARGGAAPLGDLYAHLAQASVSRTIRQTSATVEDLVGAGELVEGSKLGHYRLAQIPETRGKKGDLHEKLWRALHRRIEREGSATCPDLATLARCTKDAARKWLAALVTEGRLIKNTVNGSNTPRYRLAPDQPGPHQPPPFRWPRRGKARSKKDLLEKGNGNG